MRRILAKWRAIFGTGLVGGVLGSLLGGVFGAALAFLSPGGPVLEMILGSAAAMGGFGAFVGTGFAAALTVLPQRASIESLPTPVVGAIGFLLGGLISPLASALTGGVLFGAAAEWVSFSVLFGILGGSLSAGIVAVAKHESRQALAGNDVAAVVGSGHDQPPRGAAP